MWVGPVLRPPLTAQAAKKAGEYISILPGSLGAGTTKFLVGDETPLLELAAGGAAAPRMVLSRPKDLCEVETAEEEE